MKTRISYLNSLRTLALAILAVGMTVSGLSAHAYDYDRDSDRSDYDNRRGPRRGDLRDPREAARLVDLLYVGALNRYADQEGIDGFGREIMNRGYQGLYDSARLIGSVPEFAERVQDVGSRRVVFNIYRVFFNRRPDPSGLSNWTRMIDEGRGGDALEGIVKSQEFFETQL
ncbi:DUF4214 domain-containing protein [Bdellovibrio sp. HCB337]|uniref:DUF4214 domain-containing protein n=1 Tax=Bdellovibrio sp. HCB337 TaxID=3394358 RepID=UPI0039A68C7D